MEDSDKDTALRQWAIEQASRAMSGCSEFSLPFLKNAAEWCYKFVVDGRTPYTKYEKAECNMDDGK